MKQMIILAVPAFLWGTATQAQSDTAYKKEIERWHAQRIQALKAPNGWLNLVGLYWLEDGQSSFGSNPENKIVFPSGSVPETAGYFQKEGETVRLVVADGVPVTVDGQPVTDAVVFNKDSLRQPIAACGSLRWTIIKRDNKIGIRLRDLHSPLAASFKDIDRFPVDTAWRVTAVLQPAHQEIPITNIIGQTSEQRSPGKLVFTIHGQQYTLDALEEGDELFIVFGDATSGKTTYPSGRFLSVPKPTTTNNITVIDFNKAYNPPCAFTHYATCPLPPKENILPIEVEAGEKSAGH
jgi:uncharacterized protein (DUF1684 family)